MQKVKATTTVCGDFTVSLVLKYIGAICYNLIIVIKKSMKEVFVLKLFKVMFIVITVVLISAGCTKTQNVREKAVGGEEIHDTFHIKPGGSYEECIELKPGMVFDYDYESSDAVNFNIHYHAEDGIHFPVDRKGVMMGKGMLDPGTHDFYTKDQEAYCLMWDNLTDDRVKVSFTCILRGK